MPRNPKRVTVEVPAQLFAQLRQIAAREGITTTTATTIALREWVARQQPAANGAHQETPSIV